MNIDPTLNVIKDYYGKTLKSSADLKTSACCAAEIMPAHLQSVLREIHPEVRERFYGCGSPIPPVLDGRTVLDLGSGSGRDAYMLSKLVGEKGQVIGIDMTDEQIDVARKYGDYHMKQFGYSKPNVKFVKGYIEDLAGAGIAPESVDLVVSNCVANLSPDKPRLFKEIFKALKPGGELYFSDVFADRRIPAELRQDPVLLGECLSGAMYDEDFRRLMFEVGCRDVRAMNKAPIALTGTEVERKIGMVNFYSITFRAFKLELEDRCEDYGQVAIYKGTVASSLHRFVFDDHHTFYAGKPAPVCGNTADMLSKTAYAPHFEVVGEKATHFGLFDCAPIGGLASQNPAANSTGACC